jgi:TPR repeat protein
MLAGAKQQHDIFSDCMMGKGWQLTAVPSTPEAAKAPDPKEREVEFKKQLNLANQGDPNAQSNVALAYLTGDGVPNDTSQAVAWLNKAGDRADPVAQVAVGMFYHNGWGVPQDDAEAVKWYRRAANQGNAQGTAMAQYAMGVAYFTGQGVFQDFTYAYAWLNLACSGLGPSKMRDQAVAMRDALAAKLTPEQLATAQQMGRDWLAHRPFDPST